jgi:hypothetical protein
MAQACLKRRRVGSRSSLWEVPRSWALMRAAPAELAREAPKIRALVLAHAHFG